jgi:hypothetical protein
LGTHLPPARPKARPRHGPRSREAFAASLASAERALLEGNLGTAQAEFLRALDIARAVGLADYELRALRAGLWHTIDSAYAFGGPLDPRGREGKK